LAGVTAREHSTGEIQFAGDSRRHRFESIIEHDGVDPGQWIPDGSVVSVS